MSRTKLTLWICLAYVCCAYPQHKLVDSLLVALKQAQTDQEKTTLYNHLADEYKTSDPKKTLGYARLALQLSEKTGNRIEQGTAYINMGNAYIITGKYLLALDNMSKAQHIFERQLQSREFKNKQTVMNGLARAYGSIGFVFMEQSSYDKALEYNYKALRIYEQTKNKDKLARIYNNIGVIYQSQEQSWKALVFYQKGFKIQKELADPNIGITSNNIGLVYLQKKNYRKSLEYFNQAETFFDKFPNPRGQGELYNNLGNYYNEVKNPDRAIVYLNQALDRFKSIDDRFGTADTYANLGTIYADRKAYPQAIANIDKSLQIARELGVLDRAQESEKKLSEIYEKLGDTKQALVHYKLYSIAKDKVTNNQTVKNSVRAELNFDFERKELLQREEQEKKDLLFEEQKRTNQIKTIASFVLASLLAGIAFLIYNRRQLKKRLTLEKELAVYEQKALHLQMNPHFIFNCLGSISSFIVQNSIQAAISYLAKFSKLMRLTLEYSKESLIPIDKEIEILQNYLELEQLRFNNKFDFSIKKSGDIEDDVALPPLLLQPFVENAIIHGLNPSEKTGNISVAFSIVEDSLFCEISDDGIGINESKKLKKSQVRMHKSMALDITSKRLEILADSTSKNAGVQIEEINQNGEIKGTKVEVVLPLQYLAAM